MTLKFKLSKIVGQEYWPRGFDGKACPGPG